jgi:predicted enzyme related to lactoylglutathione lyase
MSSTPPAQSHGVNTPNPEGVQPVSINHVLAGIAVADVDAALPWYERLFGRPADALPMEGLAEWQVPSGGVVQLVADVERAGRSLLTLDLDGLEHELAAMRVRGLDAGALDDTTSDKVLIATTTDPEGNAITLVEQR